MSVALATRGLGKRYGRRWALSDCTLEVPAGHVAGLVGPNGAGKTTLLQLAVGLIEPSAGSIAVLGEDAVITPKAIIPDHDQFEQSITETAIGYAGLHVAGKLKILSVGGVVATVPTIASAAL